MKRYNKGPLFASLTAALILAPFAHTESVTTVSAAASVTKETVAYDTAFDTLIDVQLTRAPKANGTGTIAATRKLVEYYANPANFKENTSGYMQFLALDKRAQVTATEINNKLLTSKGSLAGTGTAFIEAGKKYNLNELYLISHALHETAHGTSVLAKGVPVDATGNVVSKSEAAHIVYNMYGISAYDGSAVASAAKYAFDKGWFSPSKAIIGGAGDIAAKYINKGQDTLYEMRWNPANTGKNQYATHVAWAKIQADTISSMYHSLNRYPAAFEVPQLKNQPASTGSTPPMVIYPKGTVGATNTLVNFRSKPYVASETYIGKLESGTKINVLGKTSANWYKVEANGKVGYLYHPYVDIDNLLQVTVSSLNVRTAPGGEKVGALEYGTHVVGVLDDKGNLVRSNEWYKAYVNGTARWISDGYYRNYVAEIK